LNDTHARTFVKGVAAGIEIVTEEDLSSVQEMKEPSSDALLRSGGQLQKRKDGDPMKTYRIAISLTVLLLSTFVTAQAARNEVATRGVRNGRLNVALSLSPNLSTGKISRLKLRMPALSRRARARLATLVSRGCGCALAQEQEVFGSCWRTCVMSWGVSYGTLSACGGACIAASTGNPIAIAVCAGCVGTAEWILAGCALYCSWGNTGGHGILQQDPQAKLRHRSTNSTRI